MDKYSGMNKVEAKLTENREIVKKEPEQTPKDPKRKGALRRFVVQSVVAALICGALFACKVFLPYASAVKKVKAAFGFNAVEYVSELIDKEKKDD